MYLKKYVKSCFEYIFLMKSRKRTARLSLSIRIKMSKRQASLFEYTFTKKVHSLNTFLMAHPASISINKSEAALKVINVKIEKDVKLTVN